MIGTSLMMRPSRRVRVRILTEGSRVVVEVAQGTDGMLMLGKLHKAQPPGAGQPICWVNALWIPQNLGLLHSRLRLGGMLLHLHTQTYGFSCSPFPRVAQMLEVHA